MVDQPPICREVGKIGLIEGCVGVAEMPPQRGHDPRTGRPGPDAPNTLIGGQRLDDAVQLRIIPRHDQGLDQDLTRTRRGEPRQGAIRILQMVKRPVTIDDFEAAEIGEGNRAIEIEQANFPLWITPQHLGDIERVCVGADHIATALFEKFCVQANAGADFEHPLGFKIQPESGEMRLSRMVNAQRLRLQKHRKIRGHLALPLRRLQQSGVV